MQEHLLTPYGLHSLAPGDLQYHGRYTGGPAERDSAYHQGMVWPWLIGPFITAYVRVNGGTSGIASASRRVAQTAPRSFIRWWMGHISEILDGDQPHRPCGCIAQAWSVAEVLRAYVEDVKGMPPTRQADERRAEVARVPTILLTSKS